VLRLAKGDGGAGPVAVDCDPGGAVVLDPAGRPTDPGAFEVDVGLADADLGGAAAS
jgi:hypothetical protein